MTFAEKKQELTCNYYVFPCGVDKKPQVSSWKQNCCLVSMALPAWDGASHLAIPTGERNGLFVIDLDKKGGIDGITGFKAWLEANGIQLPGNVPIIRTPSGGLHLYFNYPQGSGITIGQDFQGVRGVDWRGEGGFIIYYGADKLQKGSMGDIPDLPAALVTKFQDGRSKSKKDPFMDGMQRDASGKLIDGRDELARNLAYKCVMRCADKLGEWPGSDAYPALLAELVDEYKKLASFDAADATRNETFLQDKLDYALVNCESKWERKRRKAERRKQEGDNLSPALRFTTLGDLPLYPSIDQPYLVKGLLGEKNLSVVYGPPASGKSFFVMDMAYSIAAGEPYRGLRVKPDNGGVLYMSLEGTQGMNNRLIAKRRSYPNALAEERFMLSASRFSLFEEEGMDDLLELLDDIDMKQEKFPSLIVIDTLARAMGSGSENDTQDIARLVEHADQVKDYTGANVLLVHHTGKDASRGARGSNALLGAVDTEISVGPVDDCHGLKLAKVTKQKEMDANVSLYFRLLVEELGIDGDGDAITSCLVRTVTMQEAEQEVELAAAESKAKT